MLSSLCDFVCTLIVVSVRTERFAGSVLVEALLDPSLYCLTQEAISKISTFSLTRKMLMKVIYLCSILYF